MPRIRRHLAGSVAPIATGILLALAPSASVAAQAPQQARPAATTSATDPGLARLEAEMTRLAAIAGGKVGVAAIHLETGREVVLNRGEPFPMASTFKVPIAVQLLTRVDSGQLRLDSMITIQPSDLHPGSGTLTQLFDDPGVSLSVRNLMELMLLDQRQQRDGHHAAHGWRQRAGQRSAPRAERVGHLGRPSDAAAHRGCRGRDEPAARERADAAGIQCAHARRVE